MCVIEPMNVVHCADLSDASIFESATNNLGIASFHNVRLAPSTQTSQRGACFFSVGMVTSPLSEDDNDPMSLRNRRQISTCLCYTTRLAELGEKIATVIAGCPSLDLTLVQPLLGEMLDGHDKSEHGPDPADSDESASVCAPSQKAVREVATLVHDFFVQVSSPKDLLVAGTRKTGSIQNGSSTLHNNSFPGDDDALSFLPAVHYGLGPLLPKLIKLLLPEYLTLTGGAADSRPEGGKRILIYCPPGNALYTASMFALNFLFLLRDIHQRGHSVFAAVGSTGSSGYRSLVRDPVSHFRGYLSLHDLPKLEQEARSRELAADHDRPTIRAKAGWVGVTTDRVIIEKPLIFDVLIDLTNVMASGTGGAVRAGGTAALAQGGPHAFIEDHRMALPTVSLACRDKVSGKPALTQMNWTSADFGNWNQVEERASELRDAYVAANLSRLWRRSNTAAAETEVLETNSPTEENHTSGQNEAQEHRVPGHLAPVPPSSGYPARKSRVLSTLIAFLRYCLAGRGWLSIVVTGPLGYAPLRIGGNSRLSLGEDDDDTLPTRIQSDLHERQGSDRSGSTSLWRKGSTDSPLNTVSKGLPPQVTSTPNTSEVDSSTVVRGSAEGDASVLEGSAASLLAQAWSEWGAEVVLGVGRALDAAYTASRLAINEPDSSPAPVYMSARTLRQLGLDARDTVDYRLTESIFSLISTTEAQLIIHGQWFVFF